MIPKTIHYCWFGHNSKPDLAKKCIKSWKKYCPDYEIIEWNEDNFDISACPLYVRQAYEAKKWAFVTDYVRLKVVYDHGGIYMDTDVELKKALDSLLSHQAYFGFEDGVHIATGLGFGAIPEHPLLKEIMNDYEGIPFVLEDGSFDKETCPSRNTKILLRHGLRQDDSWQILEGDILVLPSICLCPLSYQTGKRRFSPKTISVHWFDASWRTEAEKAYQKEKIARERMDAIKHLPNRLLRGVMGTERYENLKKLLKRGK